MPKCFIIYILYVRLSHILKHYVMLCYVVIGRRVNLMGREGCNMNLKWN